MACAVARGRCAAGHEAAARAAPLLGHPTYHVCGATWPREDEIVLGAWPQELLLPTLISCLTKWCTTTGCRRYCSAVHRGARTSIRFLDSFDAGDRRVLACHGNPLGVLQ